MDPDRLATLPLFAGLDDERPRRGRRLHARGDDPGGGDVAAQGDNAYEFFVIEAGEAEVRKGGEVIATVRQGDVVGEIGLLVTGTRTASIVATTPMTLVAMFSREFKQIETRMPAISYGLRATMRERVARTSFERCIVRARSSIGEIPRVSDRGLRRRAIGLSAVCGSENGVAPDAAARRFRRLAAFPPSCC